MEYTSLLISGLYIPAISALLYFKTTGEQKLQNLIQNVLQKGFL